MPVNINHRKKDKRDLIKFELELVRLSLDNKLQEIKTLLQEYKVDINVERARRRYSEITTQPDIFCDVYEHFPYYSEHTKTKALQGFYSLEPLYTPLSISIKFNYKNLTEFLLCENARVQDKDFQLAIEGNNHDTLKQLFDSNVKIGFKVFKIAMGHRNLDALHILLSNIKPTAIFINSLLSQAISDGHYQAALVINNFRRLKNYPQEDSVLCSLKNKLRSEIDADSASNIEALINLGADPNAAFASGAEHNSSALNYAIYCKKNNAAKKLVELGANVAFVTQQQTLNVNNCSVHEICSGGNTTLMLAAASGNGEMLKYLEENHAPIYGEVGFELTNYLGQTVYDLATESGITARLAYFESIKRRKIDKMFLEPPMAKKAGDLSKLFMLQDHVLAACIPHKGDFLEKKQTTPSTRPLKRMKK